MSSAFWRKVSRPAAKSRLSRSSLDGELRLPDVRVGVLAQVDACDLALALEDDELQVAQRVGLEAIRGR